MALAVGGGTRTDHGGSAATSSGRSGSMGLIERLRSTLRPLDEGFAEPSNLAEIADLLPPPERLVPAAVLVPLLAEEGEPPELVLIRRTEGLPTHAGQFAFPGGRMEPCDPDPVATAMREAREELGWAPERLEPLGLLDTLLTITAFKVLPVVARIGGGFEPVPDPHEVAEVFRVPLDFFLDPTQLRIERIEHRGRVRRILAYHYQGRRIWGATALILADLARRLGGEPR